MPAGISEAFIESTVKDFITSNFLFNDASRSCAPNDSFIKKGIIDSTGILEVIEFLEKTFEIRIDETETIPANLDSLANLKAFVAKKLGQLPWSQ